MSEDWKKRCENNKLCVAEVDSRNRSTWFLLISFLTTKPVELGGKPAEQTVSGMFEVLQFAPTFQELDYYEGPEENQLNWEGSAIYNKLRLIHSGETIAFVKMSDLLSIKLADVRREHRPITEMKFGLSKYSRNGGVTHHFRFDMSGVFILDIKQSGAAEKYLLTFSKSNFSGSMPSK